MSESSESFVEKIFKSRGFNIVKIDEGEMKTPDFFISNDQENYLLEVKEKQDSDELKKRLNALQQGEILDPSFSLSSHRSINKIISKAKAQIQAVVDKYNEVYKIVWFHSNAAQKEAYKEQIINSLFGRVYLWNLKNGKSGYCYYFENSIFYNYRNEIDAVFVADNENYRLCLNNFSLNYERIKKSKLIEFFTDGVVDPLQEEHEGRGYLADTDINRAEPTKVLEYLNIKYKTKFTEFRVYSDSVMTVIK